MRSGLVVVYFLFQAPMWCCAETFCRNNANGLLLGCKLRQHKWQKVGLLFRQHAWGRFARRVLTGIGGQAATVGALAGAVSAVAAVITLVAA